MKKIKFIVGKTATGYDAYSEINKKIVTITTGSDLSELKLNALAAYNLYLEEKKKTVIEINDLVFEFDLPSFFEYYKEINASALGKRIGMHKSYYQNMLTEKERLRPNRYKR